MISTDGYLAKILVHHISNDIAEMPLVIIATAVRVVKDMIIGRTVAVAMPPRRRQERRQDESNATTFRDLAKTTDSKWLSMLPQ